MPWTEQSRPLRTSSLHSMPCRMVSQPPTLSLPRLCCTLSAFVFNLSINCSMDTHMCSSSANTTSPRPIDASAWRTFPRILSLFIAPITSCCAFTRASTSAAAWLLFVFWDIPSIRWLPIGTISSFRSPTIRAAFPLIYYNGVLPGSVYILRFWLYYRVIVVPPPPRWVGWRQSY